MKLVKLFFALVVGVALSGATMPAAHALNASGQVVVQWQEPGPPPGNWSDAWHRGFHEGAQAAHHDIQAGRSPDPNRHDSFRHPDARGPARHDFRDGFRHGYHMVYNRDWHRGH